MLHKSDYLVVFLIIITYFLSAVFYFYQVDLTLGAYLVETRQTWLLGVLSLVSDVNILYTSFAFSIGFPLLLLLTNVLKRNWKRSGFLLFVCIFQIAAFLAIDTVLMGPYLESHLSLSREL